MTEELADLQRAVVQMQALLALLLAQSWPPRLYVEVRDLHTESVQFAVGAIAVDDLSGQMNIGLTHVAGTRLWPPAEGERSG